MGSNLADFLYFLAPTLHFIPRDMRAFPVSVRKIPTLQGSEIPHADSVTCVSPKPLLFGQLRHHRLPYSKQGQERPHHSHQAPEASALSSYHGTLPMPE